MTTKAREIITFVLRRLKPLVRFVLRKLGYESCGECSQRFQTLLEKLGFIICHDLGYALPVEGFSCRESPFQITWDAVKNHHTDAAFKALEMYAQFHDPKFMEGVKQEIRRRMEEREWIRMDGPVVGLRGRVIPVTTKESRDERTRDRSKSATS